MQKLAHQLNRNLKMNHLRNLRLQKKLPKSRRRLKTQQIKDFHSSDPGYRPRLKRRAVIVMTNPLLNLSRKLAPNLPLLRQKHLELKRKVQRLPKISVTLLNRRVVTVYSPCHHRLSSLRLTK